MKSENTLWWDGSQEMNACSDPAAAAAKSLQSCLTLCDSIDGSPPGSPIPGILQARILEWVAISFSNTWKWKVKVKLLSCVRLLATPWTAAYQGPPSMGFSRQEYWSGVPLPSPCSDPVPTDCIQRTVKLIFLYDLAFMLQTLKWLDLLKYGIWLLSLVSKGFF